MDLAKHENNIGLQLESSWRITDWNADREDLQHLVSIVSDPPTPRTKTYEAFLALSNIEENSDKISELQRVCDEGLQCSLRKWVSMPSIVSQSHVPLLHTFQQYVELQEASHIYLSVGLANVQSRVQAVQELKGTLGTWRGMQLAGRLRHLLPGLLRAPQTACPTFGTILGAGAS